MTKRNFLSLLAMFLLAGGALYAENSRPVKANIPFDFTAGNVDLPAGEYQIGTTGTVGTLLIRGEDTQGMFLGSQADQANSRPAGSRLVFHRYGDRVRPRLIAPSGGCGGCHWIWWRFWSTKVEKELRASTARPTLVAVLAYK